MWYDDEDDVLLGNTLCDVVGPEALTDNIISAEFPDDNDRLFNLNDFLDRNEGLDLDMGSHPRRRDIIPIQILFTSPVHSCFSLTSCVACPSLVITSVE